MLSFVFLSTTAIALSGQAGNSKYLSKLNFTKKYPDLPVLKENSNFPVFSAQSVMVMDLDSGVTLFEKNPDKKLLPASTTKIVTALVALDVYDLDQVLKVGKVTVEGQKMGLVYGESMKFIDLLNGLLIYSANDAAEVLAQNYIGGREMFIALMNKKAKDLGLKNTHFTNPVGLDADGHYSTAKDLVVVSKVAMQNPVFAKIVGTKEKTVKSVDDRISHRLVNINKLLGNVEGVLGVKTGWTENARENLVTEVDRNGRRIMIVVLGSSDRFGETGEIIEWVFNNYRWQSVNPKINLNYSE